MSAQLERIAAALERIADAMEGQGGPVNSFPEVTADQVHRAVLQFGGRDTRVGHGDQANG